MRPKTVLTAFAAMSLWLAPAVSLADDGPIAEGYGADAAEAHNDHHGDHDGHHDSFSLTDIIQGEDSLEFWGAVVNFVLLLLVLRKLGKAPLQNFLSSRSKAVQEGMEEAAALKAEAQKVYDEYNERLKTMDADIEKLKRDIREAAEADKQRIIDEAKHSAERMRADTENLINQQARELSAEVRAEVVEAAMAAAEAVIRERLTADEQQTLAQNYKKELSQEPATDFQPEYGGSAAQLGGQS